MHPGFVTHYKKLCLVGAPCYSSDVCSEIALVIYILYCMSLNCYYSCIENSSLLSNPFKMELVHQINLRGPEMINVRGKKTSC